MNTSVRETLCWVLAILVGLSLFVGLTWALVGTSLLMDKFFLPRQEAIRRQTFEQSKAYNQGTIQELQNMQLEYLQADPSQKTAIASIILHRAADYDVNLLPADLRNFIAGLRARKGN